MNMHPYTTVAVDQLMKLVNIPSPTGFTHMAAEYLMDVLTGYGFEPYQTHKGNVVCCIGGEGHPLIQKTAQTGVVFRAVQTGGNLPELIRVTTLAAEAECIQHTGSRQKFNSASGEGLRGGGRPDGGQFQHQVSAAHQG